MVCKQPQIKSLGVGDKLRPNLFSPHDCQNKHAQGAVARAILISCQPAYELMLGAAATLAGTLMPVLILEKKVYKWL